jgi:hypothetical protein
MRELEVRRERIHHAPEVIQKSADAVLNCGRATLQRLGRSEVTPWNGPPEVAELIRGIETAEEDAATAKVREQASKVVDTVDRVSLQLADHQIGELNASRDRWRTTPVLKAEDKTGTYQAPLWEKISIFAFGVLFVIALRLRQQ